MATLLAQNRVTRRHRSKAVAVRAVLLSTVLCSFGADTASAQDTTVVVVIVINESGQPVAGAQLASILNSVKQPRGATDSTGTLRFDTNLLNLPKNSQVTVVVVRCGEQVEVQLVAPGDKRRCEDEKDPQKKCECREAGILLWGHGGTLTIRLTPGGGTMQFTETGGAAGGGGAFGARFIGFGAFKFSGFTNAGEAADVIVLRYTNAHYDQNATKADEADDGSAWGGGLQFSFGVPVGVEVLVMYQDMGGAKVDTTGTRAAGSLAFSLNGRFKVKTWGALFGVPVFLGDRWVVTPFLGWQRWDLEEVVVDALRVAGTQVSGGTTTTKRKGTDPSGGIRVAVFLPGGWLGIVGQYEYMKLKGAFEPDGPAGWPADLKHSNGLVGAMVRFK